MRNYTFNRSPWKTFLLAAVVGWSGILSAEPLPQISTAMLAELQWLQAEAVLVSTASLRDETVSHAPATIRVVTKRQIRERGYRSLYELLRDLPGIDVLDHVQAEAKNRIGIRGISGNNRFLIMQDGIRINSPTGEPITPVAENFPLYNVKQVEILYGPASSLYGADAFTGVINLITEEATEEGAVNVTLEGGEFDSFRADFYAAKMLSPGIALSVGGHVQETDGVNLRKEYNLPFGDLTFFDNSVAFSEQDRNEYNGSYSSYSTWMKLVLKESLTLGWNQSLFQSRYSEGSNPEVLTNYEEEGETLLLTGYAKYQFELSDSVRGHVQANYSRYEQLPSSQFRNRIVGFEDGFKYGLGERYQVEPQITWHIDDIHTLVTGATLEYFNSIPHTADFGSRYDRDKSSQNQGQYYANTDGALPIEVFEVDYNNYGGFLQEQAQWTEKFSTTVGVRVDHNTDYGTTTNPRVGAVYEASSRTTWKALYGQAYLAPVPFLRFENFGGFAFKRPDGKYQSFFFRVPNEDLKPEELQTAEVSVSHTPRKGLTTSLTGFYTEVDQLVLVAPTDPIESDFVQGGVINFTESNQNIGKANSYGGELVVEQETIQESSRLNLWASLTLQDGELEDTLTGLNVNLPFTSQQMVKAGLTYNLRDRLVISPVVRWNGAQSGFDTADTTIATDDFTVVDLYSEIRNRKQNVSLYLRVSNLFDEHYYNGGRSSANVFNQAPQDTRWITAGIKIDL